MRLGKVYISHEYVVDLENETMVDEAKECMYEDLLNAVKYEELYDCIHTKEDKNLSKNDIPEFLLEEE